MIFAVDPGATSAVAIYAGGPTPAVTSIDEPSMDYRKLLIKWAVDTAARRDEPLSFVIEDQYAAIRWVPNNRSGKPEPTIDVPALVSLVRNAERWVVAAERYGLKAVRVMPATWQGPMLADAPKIKDGKKLSEKQRARIVVAKTWTEVPSFKGLPLIENLKRIKVARLNEHIRDAMLIGRWQQLHGEARR